MKTLLLIWLAVGVSILSVGAHIDHCINEKLNRDFRAAAESSYNRNIESYNPQLTVNGSTLQGQTK